MKLPVVLLQLRALAAIWRRCVSCGMQARTAAILPFLLRMLLPAILSGHDNQASISDPGHHFALKRRFRSEMDFSRPVASTTNRAPIFVSYRLCELANCKKNTTRRRESYKISALSSVNETSVHFCYHICG